MFFYSGQLFQVITWIEFPFDMSIFFTLNSIYKFGGKHPREAWDRTRASIIEVGLAVDIHLLPIEPKCK
jgi:hypothetical protein